MTPAIEQLLGSAMQLPEGQRLDLAEALFAVSEPPPPALTGDAWLAELRRRSAEIDSGEVALSTWAEVKRRVRHRLEQRTNG
jgi:putative addiction module component (TIGR02574 family)